MVVVWTLICVFRPPGDDEGVTLLESAGLYDFKIQSIENPAGLMILFQTLPRTAGQYQLNPEFTPVAFHSAIL